MKSKFIVGGIIAILLIAVLVISTSSKTEKKGFFAKLFSKK